MSISIPYIPPFSPFLIDQWAVFIVAVLLAVMVHAEGQGFMATTLGDHGFDEKTRHHFNAFLHLDILGTLNFLIAGFGWPKPIPYSTAQLSLPYFKHLLIRLSGPAANLIMASIAGSIVWILGRWGVEDEVFIVVLGVNLTAAIYTLIPIPPLAGSALYIIPQRIDPRTLRIIRWGGGILLILAFQAARWGLWSGLSPWIDPVSSAILNYLVAK